MSDTPLSNLFSAPGAGGGPVNWEVARQVAMSMASGGEAETTVDPATVKTYEGLVRAAELTLARVGVIGEGADLPTVRILTRATWASDTIDGLHPLIERLAGRLGSLGSGLGSAFVMPGGLEGLGGPEAEGGDMAGALAKAMESIVKPLAPIFMGLQMGLVMGFVATRATHQYDLCLPRSSAPAISLIANNIDEVASELGVPPDEVRMWVAMHEVVHHSEFALGWTARRLQALLEAYIESIRFNGDELQEHMRGLDPQDPESLQRFADNAEGLLGRFISTDQPDVLESVQTFMSVLEGYADHSVELASAGMIANAGLIADGLRRRSEESGRSDRLLESLLGLELTPAHIETGRYFCTFVATREDMATLNRMWEGIETLPTREELNQPEMWLERIRTTPTGGSFRDA